MILNPNTYYRSPEGYEAVQTRYSVQLSRWPVPYTSRWIETRHGGTQVLCAGREDAPPLFFFHGWGGNQSGTYLELDLALLVEHYRLYLPDTVGQSGRSAPYRPPTLGPAFGEWARDLFDALGIDRAYLSGISGGGYLTLKAAAHAPDRVHKVLAISSAGLTLLVPKLRFLMGAVAVRTRPTPHTGMHFVRASSATAAPKTWRHERMAEDMALFFQHYRFDSGPRPLSDAELSRISAPVYLLMGEQDAGVRVPRAVARAQKTIASLEVEIVEDAGHFLTLDCPGLTEQRMLDLFR